MASAPNSSPAPAAIVGLGGVFPSAPDVASFWRNVLAARVAESRSLEARWGLARERYFAAQGGPDRTYLDHAYCLDDRLLAGETHRQVGFGRMAIDAALRDAGPARHGAKQTALVCGTSWSDESYFDADAARVLGNPCAITPITPQAQLEALVGEDVVGGPRLAVDTACASSLYALDTALGLLELGIAGRVLVLGLNAALPPWLFVGFSKLGATSPRCEIKPFARDASGIVPGECAACVVLERLDEAVHAGKRVRAVVRAVGTSADGANRSVFAPAPEGQRLAYERAYGALPDREVDYLEAHGTATQVGDDVELDTLHGFFSGTEAAQGRIALGAVKSLIGHTLAAAGLASLIKAALVLEQRVAPPHIAVEAHERLAGTCLDLPRRPIALSAPGKRPLRAGVSSFGFGGANAHAVLEAFDARAHAMARAAKRKPAPLAIVGAQLALGSHYGAQPALDALDTELEQRELPRARFGYESRERTAGLGAGAYFPASLTIDASGLRMGPNFLRRLDPLQLVLTDLSQRLARALPGLARSTTTGALMTSSMGGEKALALGRRCTEVLADAATPEPGNEMTLEAIASALPTMCSGYPAYHLDLRGFHGTWAGAAGTFITSLALAPYWLERGLDHLLVGAAHMLKSPVDLDELSTLRGARSTHESEGAGVFAFSTLAGAQDRGESVIALLHAIVPASEAGSVGEACRWASVDPARIARVDVCQLAADADPAAGSTQTVSGFLHEAVGIECLARALRAPGMTALEVRKGRELVCIALVECTGELPGELPARLPLEVTLGTPPREAEVPAAEPRAHTLEAAAAGEALDERAMRSWLASTQAVMQAYFRAQGDAAQKLANVPRGGDQSIASLRPREHLVIRGATRAHDGSLSATLVVDEGHPFHFDHPLDHVPGILLVEAVQQLCEAALPASLPSSLDLRFLRFCEKHEPTMLRLGRQGERQWQVRFEQRGRAVAMGMVTCVARAASTLAQAPALTASSAPETNMQKVHKQRAENVLVSPLVPSLHGGAECRALLPASRHALAAGSPDVWSLTYLLEVARQSLMLAAHGMLGIPQGKPMNLLGVSVSAPVPLSRADALTLALAPLGKASADGPLVADVPIAFRTRRGEAASVRLKAQVVEPHIYQEQRWNP